MHFVTFTTVALSASVAMAGTWLNSTGPSPPLSTGTSMSSMPMVKRDTALTNITSGLVYRARSYNETLHRRYTNETKAMTSMPMQKRSDNTTSEMGHMPMKREARNSTVFGKRSHWLNSTTPIHQRSLQLNSTVASKNGTLVARHIQLNSTLGHKKNVTHTLTARRVSLNSTMAHKNTTGKAYYTLKAKLFQRRAWNATAF